LDEDKAREEARNKTGEEAVGNTSLIFTSTQSGSMEEEETLKYKKRRKKRKVHKKKNDVTKKKMKIVEEAK
jgi:predicted ATPase